MINWTKIKIVVDRTSPRRFCSAGLRPGAFVRRIFFAPCRRPALQFHPPPAGEQRNRAGQHEKQLRDGRVIDAQRIHVHRHAQPAEHALRHDEEKRGHAEPGHPRARILEPEPDGENRRHQADERSEQPVGMLVKNPAQPFLIGNRNML